VCPAFFSGQFVQFCALLFFYRCLIVSCPFFLAVRLCDYFTLSPAGRRFTTNAIQRPGETAEIYEALHARIQARTA